MKNIVTATQKGVAKRNYTIGGTRRSYPLAAKRIQNGRK